MHTVITLPSRQTQKLHTLIVDTHLCMAIMNLYTMHLINCSVYIHAMDTYWVAIQCEASGASEVTSTIDEASKATCRPEGYCVSNP